MLHPEQLTDESDTVRSLREKAAAVRSHSINHARSRTNWKKGLQLYYNFKICKHLILT